MYWPNPEEALSDNPTVPIKLKNPYELPYVSFLPYGASQGIDRVPFPNSQKGFFYYHTKPTPSPYSGQLRFRLTPVADPDSWASGSDLLLPNGLPWNKTVFAIATMHPKFTAIRNLMLADGLISSEMVTRCQEVLDWRRSLGPNHLLTDLGQPFVARFQSLDRGQFAIVGREEQKYVRVASFFRDMRNRLRSPYQGKRAYLVIVLSYAHSHSLGSAICQFELHVPKRTRVTRRFERLVHQSDRPPPRKIVLRVLKIVEPVSCIRDDYDGFVNEPKEGQLMTMGLGDARRPWSYNVDTGEVSHGSVGRSAWPQDDLSGLKLLFDYHPGTSCQ